MFANVYYKRTAATAKACYVCYRPTTTVLATINTVDFLYTCPGHLTDPGFATAIKDESVQISTLTPEEIAKIKEEWEEKQKKKLEKQKEKEKEKEADKDDKEKSKAPSPKASNSSGQVTPTPTTPKHERYSLHRDFYSVRQAEHRKKRQATQAKELAPRLPGAPSGMMRDV